MGCLLNLLSKVESMLDMKKIGTFLLVSIINLGISTGFAAVTSTIFWFFYFHPHTLHPRIGSAVLTTFDLPSSTAGHSALLYDLTLNVTFINKSSLTKVRFDHVISGLYYGRTKVGPSDYSVPSFKLKQERSRRVTLALQGQAKKVSADMAETFARERSEGLFNINVKVKTMLNYRFFPHRMTYYYEYDCWLQFPPVPGNGTTAVTGGFKCDWPEVDTAARTVLPQFQVFTDGWGDRSDRLVDVLEDHPIATLPNHPEEQQGGSVEEFPCRERQRRKDVSEVSHRTVGACCSPERGNAGAGEEEVCRVLVTGAER
ncbi:hypothetical protein HU200_016398 [Digitaria exilis]|uniref:Late embryogenesis abundant protein LEA-2 subgroup domain-containing protein n=1 Tax=Digitaria exilis TaxID=1010633 RepID=A0A835F8B8_9POAL|nr:hypothetical protein HU200_016398 [Digitaria exilis]